MRAAVLLALLLLSGCIFDRSGVSVPVDSGRAEARPGDAWRGDARPADAGSRDRGPTDKGSPEGPSSCGSCLLEEVCVHFTDKDCKLEKRQCKYRTEDCLSPSTNPCCGCEAEVCGAWFACAKPPGCTPVVDAGTGCFCYRR